LYLKHPVSDAGCQNEKGAATFADPLKDQSTKPDNAWLSRDIRDTLCTGLGISMPHEQRDLHQADYFFLSHCPSSEAMIIPVRTNRPIKMITSTISTLLGN
jgi:hypothetical protein